MTDFSAETAASIYGRSTDLVRVDVLEISAVGMTGPLRLVNDVIDLVNNGVTYAAARFSVLPPSQGGDAFVPTMTVELANVRHEHIAELRRAAGEYKVQANSVLTQYPEDAGTGWIRGRCSGISFADTITAKVTVWPMLGRNLSSKRMDQTNAPALF